MTIPADLPPRGQPRPPRDIPPGTVSIRCRRDGPLVVELAADLTAQGVRVRITDETGAEVPQPPSDKPALALCRCGQSGRRPFCDGSHVAARFRSRGADDGGGGDGAVPVDYAG